MRIGLRQLFTGGRQHNADFLRVVANAAEELGFASLWVPEHVVLFKSYDSTYPYGGRTAEQISKVKGFFDPFVTLAALAVLTRTVRLGTYVSIIGQRNPLITAKELATIDHLSNGRVALGAGIGWAREEYEALGVPFERRGRRVDEYLCAMKELWTTEESSFDGEFVRFSSVLAYPKPIQRPHVPVLIGGNSESTIKRIASVGDGWIGFDLDHDAIARFIDALDASLVAVGRSLSDVHLAIGRVSRGSGAASWEADARYIEDCAALGMNEVICAPGLSTPAYEDELRSYAEVVGVAGPTASLAREPSRTTGRHRGTTT